jgi:hypothetical protein
LHSRLLTARPDVRLKPERPFRSCDPSQTGRAPGGGEDAKPRYGAAQTNTTFKSTFVGWRIRLYRFMLPFAARTESGNGGRRKLRGRSRETSNSICNSGDDLSITGWVVLQAAPLFKARRNTFIATAAIIATTTDGPTVEVWTSQALGDCCSTRSDTAAARIIWVASGPTS